MSFKRWGAPALVAVGLFLVTGSARADELERCRTRVHERAQLLSVGSADLDVESRRVRDLDRVPMGDLRPIEDFHPETDRWTNRNNRIRITAYTGGWFFSNELDIENDVPIGFRLSWEVPGFIGIRWDSAFAPWSRLEVKAPAGVGGGVNPSSSRWVDGIAHAHTLSLGIFNPELSVDGLAFWAGFGFGVWVFDYDETNVFGPDSGIDASWDETAISANIFVELDYKISDVFHVGIGLRQHFINADWTDEGRFYSLNDTEQSFDTGRNDGPIDDLAGVTEITFNISILF